MSLSRSYLVAFEGTEHDVKAGRLGRHGRVERGGRRPMGSVLAAGRPRNGRGAGIGCRDVRKEPGSPSGPCFLELQQLPGLYLPRTLLAPGHQAALPCHPLVSLVSPEAQVRLSVERPAGAGGLRGAPQGFSFDLEAEGHRGLPLQVLKALGGRGCRRRSLGGDRGAASSKRWSKPA